MTTDAAYRVQQVSDADTGYGALVVNLIPASAAASEKPLEVGDYVVLHKDNGPPECEDA